MLSHVSGEGPLPENICPQCGGLGLYFFHCLDGSGFWSRTVCFKEECRWEEEIQNGKVVTLP